MLNPDMGSNMFDKKNFTQLENYNTSLERHKDDSTHKPVSAHC